MSTHSAWIGLGANLGDRQTNLQEAIDCLAQHREIDIRSISSCWETSPVGPVTQDAYLNAVALLSTCLTPRQLLDQLLSTEAALGRIRSQRWGPRTIDLDVLLFNHQLVAEPGLSVPHPYLTQRRFVLAPLIELAPGLRNPTNGTRLIDCLRQLPPGDEQVRAVSALSVPRRRQ